MFGGGSDTRHVLWTRAPAVIVQLVVVSAAGDSAGPVRRTARIRPSTVAAVRRAGGRVAAMRRPSSPSSASSSSVGGGGGGGGTVERGPRCNGRAHILITRRQGGGAEGTRRGGIRKQCVGERHQHAPGPPHPHHCSPAAHQHKPTRRPVRIHGYGHGFDDGGGGEDEDDDDDDDEDEDEDDDGATNGRAQTVRPPRPPKRLLRRFIRIK